MEAIIFNQSCWLCHEERVELSFEFDNMLRLAGFEIFGALDYAFSPIGYTKVWLLGESHFAMHTFPEKDAIYIELSSCIKDKAIDFWNKLENWALKDSICIFIGQERIHKFKE